MYIYTFQSWPHPMLQYNWNTQYIHCKFLDHPWPLLPSFKSHALKLNYTTVKYTSGWIVQNWSSTAWRYYTWLAPNPGMSLHTILLPRQPLCMYVGFLLILIYHKTIFCTNVFKFNSSNYLQLCILVIKSQLLQGF